MDISLLIKKYCNELCVANKRFYNELSMGRSDCLMEGGDETGEEELESL